MRLGHEVDVCGLIHKPVGTFSNCPGRLGIAERLLDATGERLRVVRKPSRHSMLDHVGNVPQRARDDRGLEGDREEDRARCRYLRVGLDDDTASLEPVLQLVIRESEEMDSEIRVRRGCLADLLAQRRIVTRAENAVHDIRSRNSAHHLKESPGSLVRLCWREVPDDRGVAKDTDSSPCIVVRDRVGPDSIETHERNYAVLRIPRFRKAARAEAVPGLVDGSFAVPHGDVDAVQVDMTGEEVVPEERDVRNEIVDRPDLRGLRREEQSRRGE